MPQRRTFLPFPFPVHLAFALILSFPPILTIFSIYPPLVTLSREFISISHLILKPTQPYDSAFLLTRSPSPLSAVCSNGSAAYLATQSVDSIPSPLNISLENSRRFRALPIYAVLLAHGRQGLGALFASQVRLARAIARVVEDLDGFELLPEGEREADRGAIVLFRARDERPNEDLVERINKQNRIYVSGTVWEGRKAVRIAVAGWKIDGEADARVVREVLVKALL